MLGTVRLRRVWYKLFYDQYQHLGAFPLFVSQFIGFDKWKFMRSWGDKKNNHTSSIEDEAVGEMWKNREL